MKGFKRPPMEELPADALVPPANRTETPSEFTHEVIRSQPFYYDEPTSAPDGHLSPGTLVRLIDRHGPYCTVVERHGVRVKTRIEGLRALER